jgi:hypothetical protein
MGTGNGSITSMASINHGTPATNYPKDLWTALKQNMGSDELTRLDISIVVSVDYIDTSKLPRCVTGFLREVSSFS